VAITDPNPRVAGRGLEHLRAHGVDVELGVMEEDARRLNRPFFTYVTERRPFVTLKAALSLDGMVAAQSGTRTALTGAEANSAVHRERAEVDALGIGSGTLLVDDPLLTARGVFRYRPLTRVVFDRRLRTPASARLFSTRDAGPIVVVTAPLDDSRQRQAAALAAAGAEIEVIDLDGRDDDAARDATRFLRVALGRLARREVLSLVVEGGPTLHAAFWEARLVDRVELFISPRPVGAAGVPWTALPDGGIASLSGLTAIPVGEDVQIEGYVEHVHGAR
jgi:diaminohydroxyphosphoribosylaminopyrimidine deaminase/5-amino-6-(5-phosphoribosylamino)uracil reductase